MLDRLPWIRYGQFTLLLSCYLVMSTQQQQSRQEGHNTCFGCRLFGSQRKTEKKELEFCHYPCQCPNEEFQCENGVVPVKDGCSCCYMCPRQMGDLCSKKDLCDVSKGLYCDNKNENSTGICRGRDKNPCKVDGAIFQDGEKFQPHCSQLCTCQNGFYGCVHQCPQELHRPSELTCHEPKLIKVNNKCCMEWTCQKMEASGSSYRGLESENLVNHKYLKTMVPTTVTMEPIPFSHQHRPCQGEVTDWSQCSVTCGVGVSMRIVIDKHTCARTQETQLCYFRPCHVDLQTRVNHGQDKCTPTTRGPGREHINFQGCTSVKAFQLKFCTTCKKNKCCYPEKTKIKNIKFQCHGKIEYMKYMWVKKCRCDDVCYAMDQPRYFHAAKRSRSRRVQRNRRSAA